MSFRDEEHLIAQVDEELSIKLAKDLKEAASTLTTQEVRFLVDTYYNYQNNRIRAANQVRAMAVSGEPHLVIDWLNKQNRGLEASIKGALDIYTRSKPLGRWSTSITGIGPIISAGLMSHIDFKIANTAGKIFSFAGIAPGQEWKKGEKRPWNASLKVLTFKAGDCFVKFHNHKNDHYGKYYVLRKAEEAAKNLKGEYAGQAAEILSKKTFRKDTKAKEAYEAGKLPDGHIHARARRYATKIFLSHFHTVGFWLEHHVAPPAPYPIAHMGHLDYIPPPNVELFPDLYEALKETDYYKRGGCGGKS